MQLQPVVSLESNFYILKQKRVRISLKWNVSFEAYFGNVIAGNFEAYQLHVIPEQVEDFRYVIFRVKDLLDLSDKEFKKILKRSMN